MANDSAFCWPLWDFTDVFDSVTVFLRVHFDSCLCATLPKQWLFGVNKIYLVTKQIKTPKKSRNFPRKISMVESCFDKFTGQHYWCRTPKLAFSLNIFSENSACRAHRSCVFDGKTLLYSISKYVRKNSYSRNCQKKVRRKKSIEVNLQADIL